MSVIIRLQNLPWSANALDIRQFFRGLSIPEGGVHIVGGEMGDAFIAFSTDEDARQAMMHDRELINGVQIRLLLSSRAEMQKVIETARQQSLLALKKGSGTVLTQAKASSPAATAINKPVVVPTPQPPIITASSFHNILTNTSVAVTPSFLAYQQQAGFMLIPEANGNTTVPSAKNNNDSDESGSHHSRERRRSHSRERRRSKSRSRERNIFRRRRERSRDRSRERDWSSNRRSLRHRSRSPDISRERNKDRTREGERSRNSNRESVRNNSRDGSNSNRSRNIDEDNKPKSNIEPWSATNSYQTTYNSIETGQNHLNKILSVGNSNKLSSITAPSTAQNYNTLNPSLTALNNYSLSNIIGTGISNDTFKGFALQNPYTTAQKNIDNGKENASNTTSSSAIPGIFVEKKSDETSTNEVTTDNGTGLPQEPIAFANVNPYEQMYPNLFAQAAAINSGQKSIGAKQTTTPTTIDSKKSEESRPKKVDVNETNCVKISNMCSRTTYSDLRKFFAGLFIPHNGIKMLNDKHGLRVGIAYVQFSRHSSVAKALCRSNNLLSKRAVIIEAVNEQEFIEAEDSFRPLNQDKSHGQRGNDSDNENIESNNNGGFSALNPYKKVIQLEPFTVLYIEDIPALATEQDIIKMFGSYSLYDILLIASPENRREFVAHVRFSREEDAKSAYEDRAHHQIGYRRVRIRPGTLEEMENAKEKIRLANEQLIKEEKAAEEEETKRKLEKLITDQLTREENKEQTIISMDLTQDDAYENDENGAIESSSALQDDKNNKGKEDMEIVEKFNERDEDGYQNKTGLRKSDYLTQDQFTTNLDPRRPQTPNNIPSLFDLDPLNSSNLRNQIRPNLFNDPRLRNLNERSGDNAANAIIDTLKNNLAMIGNNFNNFNLNFNNQKEINSIHNMGKNFVILKNCDYNTRINDVAQLLLTANLALKHIEPLRNERHLSTGEFIVEFRRTSDAEIAVQRFHNIQFRNRSLRVFPITPQEIADRLGKPFLSYIPGGNGIRISKSLAPDGSRNNLNSSNNAMSNNSNNTRFGNNTPQNMNFNNFRSNNPFSDNGPANNNNNNGSGRNNKSGNNSNNNCNNIPEKFARPGCVLSLENVPYKAQLTDILRFFQGFDLTPDDIIRRFNDDGSPTGDARVAFISPDQARSAFDSRRRKQMFGRNVFIKIM